MKKYKINTNCLHAGYSPKNGEPRVLPIYQSTTYKYDSSVEMGQLFDLEKSGYFYTRLSNPTRRLRSIPFSTSPPQATMSFHPPQSTAAHSTSSM